MSLTSRPLPPLPIPCPNALEICPYTTRTGASACTFYPCPSLASSPVALATPSQGYSVSLESRSRLHPASTVVAVNPRHLPGCGCLGHVLVPTLGSTRQPAGSCGIKCRTLHSFILFAGRVSSGSPLLFVPGRLEVRISLSSWLTRRCGYSIFMPSKQFADTLSPVLKNGC